MKNRQPTVAAFLAQALLDLVCQENHYKRAKRRALAKLNNPPNLGTGGKITWTRDELHERR